MIDCHEQAANEQPRNFHPRWKDSTPLWKAAWKHLAAAVNSLKPEGAPDVSGMPHALNDNECFGWEAEGWEISWNTQNTNGFLYWSMDRGNGPTWILGKGGRMTFWPREDGELYNWPEFMAPMPQEEVEDMMKQLASVWLSMPPENRRDFLDEAPDACPAPEK